MQVAGVPVGKIQSIDLTPDGQADVRMKITDAGYRPLRRGTKAIIRQASLSGVANRYIDLQLPAGRPPADDPRRRRHRPVRHDDGGRPRPALQHLRPQDAQGAQRRSSAAPPRPTRGKGEEANAGWAYLNPSLAASSRLFKALDSDTPALKRFIGAVLAAGRRPRDAARGPRRPRRPPRHHHRRHRPPEAGALDRDRRPAGLHAPRRHDLRQPARHARRPPAARRRVQARGQEAAALPGRAAPAGARRAPDAARPLRARALARRRQRPHRADEVLGAAAQRRRRADQAQRQAARRRLPGLDQGARGGHARARDGAPLRARPHRLVRRLQPLGPLRRARRRPAAPALYVNLFAARQRRAQAAARPARAERRAQATPTSLDQRWRCPGSVERGATCKPTPDFPCDASEGPLGP